MTKKDYESLEDFNYWHVKEDLVSHMMLRGVDIVLFEVLELYRYRLEEKNKPKVIDQSLEDVPF